jgi:putative protease
LLAPAGDWESLRAAAANGADAVYFGLSRFNARYRAANFSLEELPEVMAYLHGHNVRGYVAFNTLIFSDELEDALRFIRAIAAAGVDAVIVQDLGLAQLIGRMCPGLAVHGSTQMTLTEPLGIEFVRKIGVQRVILARELSVQDVQKIHAATDMPIEVFVHGALCVSYSGQCLTSESLGGRSANRGQCAQACRLPYELVVDGATRDLGDKSYLLSPQDLAAYDIIDDLARAGICSFKIEGRLKSAQYVAATTQAYRAAIDALPDAEPFVLPRQQELELAQSFSRGFTHGFLDGVNHQQLVHARFPKSRGVRIGRVVAITPRGVVVELESAQRATSPKGFSVGGELKVGDGVVFDEGHPEQDEQGGRIASAVEVKGGKGSLPLAGSQRGNREMPPSGGSRNQKERGGSYSSSLNSRFEKSHHSQVAKPQAAYPTSSGQTRQLELTFERGSVNLGAVAIGALVWKTDDPAIRRRLEASYARDRVARRIPLIAIVQAIVGKPLVITVDDDAGHEAAVSWEQLLQQAQKHPLTEALFREQFGRLGDTPFELSIVLGLEKPADAMVPKSVLNDLRRQAAQKLIELRSGTSTATVAEADVLENIRREIGERFAVTAKVGAFEGGNGSEDRSDGADILVCPSPRVRGIPAPPSGLESARTDEIVWPTEGTPKPSVTPSLHVMVRTMEQLDAALAWRAPATGGNVASVYCDFEDVRKYKAAVSAARSAGISLGLATARIIKPGEQGLLRQVADCEPDLILIRNLAGLSYYSAQFPQMPLIADYSLNVSNEATAALLAAHGVRRITPSYDLNWRQLASLFAHFPARMFEQVIHQHMPMFHMEHCVFAHTLSNGADFRTCGRPCDRHQVDLRDRAGAAHPLIPDVGCRNTVYNAAAQSAAEFVPRMKELGLSHFRVELLRETPQQAAELLTRYAAVIAGKEDGRATWKQLKVLNQLGVTRGTLED